MFVVLVNWIYCNSKVFLPVRNTLSQIIGLKSIFQHVINTVFDINNKFPDIKYGRGLLGNTQVAVDT